jgi:hypothetical protein
VIGARRRATGRRSVAAYLAGVLATYAVHRDQPNRTLVAGDTATVEIHYAGELADGTPLEFEAVDVFDFAPDGQIASLRTWYDSAAVLGDLAKAAAAAGPSPEESAASGSAAEATPARVRAALRAVRDGRGVRIAGSWSGPHPDQRGRPLALTTGLRTTAPGEPLLARALLLDLTATAEAGAPSGTTAAGIDGVAIAPAAEDAGVDLRSGDALLLRTGVDEVALHDLPPGIAAVALDARVDSTPDGLLVGEGARSSASRLKRAATPLKSSSLIPSK